MLAVEIKGLPINELHDRSISGYRFDTSPEVFPVRSGRSSTRSSGRRPTAADAAARVLGDECGVEAGKLRALSHRYDCSCMAVGVGWLDLLVAGFLVAGRRRSNSMLFAAFAGRGNAWNDGYVL